MFYGLSYHVPFIYFIGIKLMNRMAYSNNWFFYFEFVEDDLLAKQVFFLSFFLWLRSSNYDGVFC